MKVLLMVAECGVQQFWAQAGGREGGSGRNKVKQNGRDLQEFTLTLTRNYNVSKMEAQWLLCAFYENVSRLAKK